MSAGFCSFICSPYHDGKRQVRHVMIDHQLFLFFFSFSLFFLSYYFNVLESIPFSWHRHTPVSLLQEITHQTIPNCLFCSDTISTYGHPKPFLYAAREKLFETIIRQRKMRPATSRRLFLRYPLRSNSPFDISIMYQSFKRSEHGRIQKLPRL